jgi:hypothetical protein
MLAPNNIYNEPAICYCISYEGSNSNRYPKGIIINYKGERYGDQVGFTSVFAVEGNRFVSNYRIMTYKGSAIDGFEVSKMANLLARSHDFYKSLDTTDNVRDSYIIDYDTKEYQKYDFIYISGNTIDKNVETISTSSTETYSSLIPYDWRLSGSNQAITKIFGARLLDSSKDNSEFVSIDMTFAVAYYDSVNNNVINEDITKDLYSKINIVQV